MSFAAGEIPTAAGLNAVTTAYAQAAATCTAPQTTVTPIATSAVTTPGVFTVSSTGITLDGPGIYLVILSIDIGAPVTGRTFLDIDSLPNTIARVSINSGEDRGTCVSLINHASAGTRAVPLNVFQTSGATRTPTGQVRVARLLQG